MQGELWNDEELMQQIKAGNMCAFDILYKKYCIRLYKFIYSIIKTKEEAENILQDTFLKFWENRQNIEKNSSIKYYIFTIAYNLAISKLRKKVRESEYLEYVKSIQILSEETINLEIDYNDLTRKLDSIIDSLPARQKEVYLLQKVEELKYKEIAEKLNISVNTVENHMSRAIKTIREKLIT